MNDHYLQPEEIKTIWLDVKRNVPRDVIAARHDIHKRTIGKLIARIRKAGGMGKVLRDQQSRLRAKCSFGNSGFIRRKDVGPGVRETWTSILPGFDSRAFKEALIPKL